MKKLLLFSLLLSDFCALAQKIPDFGMNRIRITSPGKTILIETNPANEPSIETDKTYYWYSSNTIHTTQGGFSGKLLNGSYQEYYENKNLEVQGFFKKGVKSGTWKSWNESGKLRELINWKKGYKQGSFAQYDEEGKPEKEGRYKHNLLNGRLLIFHSKDSAEAIRYKSGKQLAKNEVSSQLSFWKRLLPFGRKKVEELTLYLIKKDEEIKSQDVRIKKLEQLVGKLMSK